MAMNVEMIGPFLGECCRRQSAIAFRNAGYEWTWLWDGINKNGTELQKRFANELATPDLAPPGTELRTKMLLNLGVQDEAGG